MYSTECFLERWDLWAGHNFRLNRNHTPKGGWLGIPSLSFVPIEPTEP